MKKTLLCFLLLFTTIFYAQGSLTVCAGQTFDLKAYKSVIIGNSNIAEASVSYHYSIGDAMNNANAITNLSNYKITTSPETIYARVDGNEVFTVLTLTEIPALTVTASNDPILCKGSTGPMKIKVSGGSGSYRYSLNGSSFSVDDYYANLFAGLYTIQVLDLVSGCSTTINHTLTEASAITATSMVSGQTAAITASGGTPPYQYSQNGGDFQTSNVFPNLAPGSYVFFAKDAHNCGATVSFNILPPLAAVTTIVKELDCIGDGTATIVATGTGGQSPYTYSINEGAYQAGNIFNNLNEGTYFITVKDAANAISNTNPVVIKPRVAVNGVALVTNPTSCGNGLIVVQVTSGQAPYYYSIDNGVTFVTSNVFYNLTAGNYYLLIKDSKGCISPTLFNTLQPPLPALAATASNIPLVCAKDKTSLTVSVTGGQAPYQYSLNNGAYKTNNTYTDLNSGTYYINVRDSNNCTTSFQYTIEQPMPIYPDIVVDGKNITINGQGGTAPYQYSVDNAAYQSGNVFTNLSLGTHTIFLKDAKGCESYAFTVTIEDPNPLTAVVTTTPMSCFTNSSLIVTAAGGQAPYSYSINGGTVYQTSNVFNNLSTGMYIVTVKDAINKIINTSPIAINSPAPLNVKITVTNANCYASADGTISVIVSGGTAPYKYALNGENYVTSNIFNNLKSGYYEIYTQDAGGCISSYTVTITEPNHLDTAVAVSTVFFTDGTIGGSITLTSSGGVAPYTYTIKENLTGIIKVDNKPATVYGGLRSGTYTIITKDANGCQIEKNDLKIRARTPMTVNAVSTPISCGTNTAQITITPSGGIAPYLYSIDGWNFTTTNTFTVTEAGTYTATVQDSLDLMSMTDHIVKLAVPVTVTADLSYYTISGQSEGKIILSSSGGTAPYSYTLKHKTNGAAVFENYTSTGFAGLHNGSYYVYSKDANGCESEKKDITVVLPEPLLITAVNTAATCMNNNSDVTVTVSGGTPPYLYSYDLGTTYTTSNTANLDPGNYAIDVKDAVGSTGRIYYSIASYASIKINLTKKDITCFGSTDGSITAAVTGGIAPYTYSLNSSAYSASNVFNNLAAGSYRITVKDAFGCLTSLSMAIVSPTILVASASVTTTGNDGKITVTASGGTAPYTYSLRNNGLPISAPQTSNIFTGLITGSYQVQVTDANGCVVIQSIVVETSPALAATAVMTPITCNTAGTITVTATGGTAPYQYSKDGTTFGSSNVFSGLAEGLYTIKTRDSQGFSISIEIFINQASPLTIDVNPTSEVYCKGENSGRISLYINDGKAPYYVSLDNGAYVNFGNSKAGTFTDLRAGTHTLSVKDTYGCIVTSTTIITEPATALIASLSVENQSVNIVATGGTAPYKYAISPNLSAFTTNNVFTNLVPGTYQVLIQDKNGCVVIFYVSIDPPAPVIDGKESVTIEFTAGQTLADLVVEGENIKWYSSQNPAAGKTSKKTETSLPLTTVLVNGTTYYASQTINGIESIERLAVTAKVKGSLSTPDFVLPDFTFHPNPVKHLLTINNSAVIDEIEIFSVSGNAVLFQKINNVHSEIDLSHLSSGFYLLKVKSDGQTKTFKIVKK